VSWPTSKSFLHWSKESLGAKPIVGIMREALVARKQVTIGCL